MVLDTARYTGASSCGWLSLLWASPPSSTVTTVVAEGWPLWEDLHHGDSKHKSGFFFFFLESLELSFKKSTNTSLAVLNTARILLSHSFCGTGNEDLFGWFWISRAFCSWMMAGAGRGESSWWLAGNLPLLTVMQCLHVWEFGLLQSFEASEPSECLQGGSRLRGECSAHKAELNCFL